MIYRTKPELGRWRGRKEIKYCTQQLTSNVGQFWVHWDREKLESVLVVEAVSMRTNLWLLTPELCAAHTLWEKSPRGEENTLFSLLFSEAQIWIFQSANNTRCNRKVFCTIFFLQLFRFGSILCIYVRENSIGQIVPLGHKCNWCSQLLSKCYQFTKCFLKKLSLVLLELRNAVLSILK